MEYRGSEYPNVFVVIGDSGSEYEVNIITKECTCPQYRIRLKGVGTCKHYVYLMCNLQEGHINHKTNIVSKQLLVDIREKQGLSDVEAYRLGENVYSLLEQFEREAEIYYDKKEHKWKVLE